MLMPFLPSPCYAVLPTGRRDVSNNDAAIASTRPTPERKRKKSSSHMTRSDSSASAASVPSVESESAGDEYLDDAHAAIATASPSRKSRRKGSRHDTRG